MTSSSASDVPIFLDYAFFAISLFYFARYLVVNRPYQNFGQFMPTYEAYEREMKTLR